MSRSLAGGLAGPVRKQASWLSRRILAHPHDQLAEVLAPEEALERTRGILQAVDDVLAIFHLTFLHPAGDVAEEVGLAVRMVGDDEALDQGPIDKQRHQVGARWGF